MRLLPRTNTAGSYVEPDWAAIHRELDRKGVTLVLLWQEYQAANAERRTWGYTQFWTHYKAFVRRLKRLMRQHRLAGEKLFIDFAGPTVPLVDGSRAQVFVAAMAASSCVFACATPPSAWRTGSKGSCARWPSTVACRSSSCLTTRAP